MVSQRELIQETFADVVRGIGAMAKTMAPGLVNAYKNVYEPIKTFRSKQPVDVLREKLKTEYFNTFDYKSVKIGKPTTLPNDPQGGSRISIPFTAKRIKGVTTQGSGLQGGLEDEQTYTAILTRDKKGVDGEYRVEVRDSQNRVIVGTKDKNQKQRPSWKDAFDNEDFTLPISVEDLANWIEDTIYLKERRLQQLYATNSITPSSGKPSMLDFITQAITPPLLSGIGTPPGALGSKDNLTTDQINSIKKIFVKSKIFNESKQNKKSQLNFLIDSYNMRYEVSIDKGN